MRSLRTRLLLAMVATQTVVLVLLGASLYMALRSALLHDFDYVSSAKAREVASLIEQYGPKVRFEFEPDRMPEFVQAVKPTRRPQYFQVWLDDGKTFARSPSLGSENLLPEAPPAHVEYQDLTLPNGLDGRLVVLPFSAMPEPTGPDFQPGPEPPGPETRPRTGVIVLARDRHQLNTILEHVRWLILGLSIGATVAGAAAIRAVTQTTLRPVETLARQIADIRAEVLDTRVQAPEAPTEFLPIVEKLNALLARLHAAFSRERGFAADVAHELRTPLAALRTELEVCRTRPREPEIYRQTLDKGLAIIDRMEHVVECLLLLARAENRQLSVRREAIQLNELLDDCWRDLASAAQRRGLRVARDVDDTLVVDTDLEKVRVILRNLLDNAVTYADEGGQVELSALREGDRIILQVGNTGSKIGQEELVHVCDRFWRGDKMRASVGTHYGLGLAIVQRLTTLLGLTLAITSEQEGWFRVRLSLPAASVVPAPA